MQLFNFFLQKEKPMCILSTIKSLFSGTSLQHSIAIISGISQMITYYEQNAANPSDQNNKDVFLDSLIQLLQKEKSTAK